jgi:hypothetical protein
MLFMVRSLFSPRGCSTSLLALSLSQVSGLWAACPPITFGPLPFTNFVGTPAGIPQQILVTDLNGDKHTDLVVLDANQPAWLKGATNATFEKPVNLPTGKITSLAVADVNEDGNPDLLFSYNQVNGVGVMLGKGDGTFATAVTYTPSPVAGSVAWFVGTGFFNADNKLDMVVVNASKGNSVSVLPGNGNGTFGPAQTNYVNAPQGSLLVADFNQDGNDDVAVGGMSGTKAALYVLLGKGNNTFQAPVTNLVAGMPFRSTTGDFNGDGFPDIAVGGTGGTLRVLLGHGDGGFTEAHSYVLGADAADLSAQDINGDGRLDMLVLAGGKLHVFEGLGGGDFALDTTLLDLKNPMALTTSDFDHDGRSDLALANYGGVGVGSVSILPNTTLVLPKLPELSFSNPRGVPRLLWYTNYTDYVLESAAFLGNGATWQAVTETPEVLDCQYILRGPTNTTRFYRLKKP